MGVRRRSVRVTRLGRVIRGRRLDRNPLRRASDRLETAVLAVLVVAFLVGAPFAALAAGGWALARGHQLRLAEEASMHQVPARVLELASKAGYTGQPEAQVRWTAPDGKLIVAEVFVPAGTTVGATVPLWTTNDGELTYPPLENEQIAEQAYFTGTLSVILLASLLTSTGLLGRRALDKRRMAALDAEWRVTGPRWTARA